MCVRVYPGALLLLCDNDELLLVFLTFGVFGNKSLKNVEPHHFSPAAALQKHIFF